LLINGQKEAEKNVKIDANSSLEVNFAVVKNISGVYEVEIDGFTDVFTVNEVLPQVVPTPTTPTPSPEKETPVITPVSPAPAAPVSPEPEEIIPPEPNKTGQGLNWYFIGGIIAGIILIIILVFLAAHRFSQRD